MTTAEYFEHIGDRIAQMMLAYSSECANFADLKVDFKKKFSEHYSILAAIELEYAEEFLLGVEKLLELGYEHSYAAPALALILDRHTDGRRSESKRSLEHIVESEYFTSYIEMVSNPIYAKLDGQEVVLFTTPSDKWSGVPIKREKKQAKVLAAWSKALRYPFSRAETALIQEIGPSLLKIGQNINGDEWYPRALIDVGLSATPAKAQLIIDYFNKSIASQFGIKKNSLEFSEHPHIDTVLGVDVLTQAAVMGSAYLLENDNLVQNVVPIGVAFNRAAGSVLAGLKRYKIDPDESVITYLGQTVHNGFHVLTNLLAINDYPGSMLILGTHTSPNHHIGQKVRFHFESNYMTPGIAKLAEYTLRVLGLTSEVIPQSFEKIVSDFGWNCRLLETDEGYLLASLWENLNVYSEHADLMIPKKYLRENVMVPIPAGWLSYKPSVERIEENLRTIGWKIVNQVTNKFGMYDRKPLSRGMVSLFVCGKI